MNIGIVDYGVGNLLSIQRCIRKIGHTTSIVESKKDLNTVGAIILPGVGAFGEAVNNLRRSNLFYEIKEFYRSGNPIIGICLGMQLLFEQSYEMGLHFGFGFIEGDVKEIPRAVEDANLIRTLPHIGWGELVNTENKLFSKLSASPSSSYYFVHSFYVDPIDKNVIAAYCNYKGFEFPAAVCSDNLYGLQFHPEKSGESGISLLSTIVKCALK